MVLIETVGQKNKNPRLRDLAAKNSRIRDIKKHKKTRFRDWNKNFRDPEFSGYHSPPLLFSMYCIHWFGNELLKSPNDYHCQVGHTNEHEPPACVARPDSTNGFVHLSPFIWRNPSLQAKAHGIFELTLSRVPKLDYFYAIWWMPGWQPTRHSFPNGLTCLGCGPLPNSNAWPHLQISPTSGRFSTLSCPNL